MIKHCPLPVFRMTFLKITFCKMTFLKFTFFKMTFYRITFHRMTFSRMTFQRMTFNKKYSAEWHFAEWDIPQNNILQNDIPRPDKMQQHNDKLFKLRQQNYKQTNHSHNVFKQSVIMRSHGQMELCLKLTKSVPTDRLRIYLWISSWSFHRRADEAIGYLEPEGKWSASRRSSVISVEKLCYRHSR